MRWLPFAVLVVASSALADEARVTPPPAPVPTPSAIRSLIERFHLFPASLANGNGDLISGAAGPSERLFHLTGDPDALVTLGDLGGNDTLRVKAAVEMNDVVLHAIAPDERMKGEGRQRAAGDYRALDSAGRPYQLRLGARLVW